MFYVIRVNAALAAMNISPTAIPSHARRLAHEFGKRRGLTPQEAALVLVADFFGIGYPTDANVMLAVQIWTHDRKIFERKPEVQEALIALSLY